MDIITKTISIVSILIGAYCAYSAGNIQHDINEKYRLSIIGINMRLSSLEEKLKNK